MSLLIILPGDDIPEHEGACHDMSAQACLSHVETLAAHLPGAFQVFGVRFGCASDSWHLAIWCIAGAFQVRFSVVGDCGRQGPGGRLVRNPRNRLLRLVGRKSQLKSVRQRSTPMRTAAEPRGPTAESEITNKVDAGGCLS